MILMAVSSVAFAYPALNDKAEFAGKYEGGGGGSMNFTLSLEITNVVNNGTQFVVHSVTTLPNGKVQAQDETYNASDLLSQETVNEILSQCSQSGGVIESVTVPAGTFQACSLPQQNGGRVWIGDVTFGLVKNIQIDEEMNKVTIELQAHQAGK